MAKLCASGLSISIDMLANKQSMNHGIIHRYRKYLPVSADMDIISLGEGQTPLIKLRHIPDLLNTKIDLYVKCEGLNPTGSFKDRGMTMAVTQALNTGSKAVLCASTGNTSASAAAYAAHAGLLAFVIIPQGKIALGKLAQATIEGAIVIQINGNFDKGMSLVKNVVDRVSVAVVNSINPYRLQGQKTAAFEIIEDLGGAPDFHYLPVGNAGNITAYWMGYTEYAVRSSVDKKPKMVGYQASGAAPFIHGRMIENPETLATAIRIGHPQSWDKAWNASKESQGWFNTCTDEEILSAQKLLATKEGIFCEPASAISLAGVIQDLKESKIPQESSVVCTLTGHGLKDPDIAIQHDANIIQVDATQDQVEAVMMDYIK